MGHDIILTFAGGMTSALLLGYLAIRIGLSPIVGYLLAGILVGPHTPGFNANLQVAEQFAEIGIILLMFGVGLKFHLHELMAVWKVAVPGALFQSLASTLLAYVLLSWLGWKSETALVTGLALSVASTVVMVRVLSDNRDLSSRTGHIAIGWVVVEDLLTILLLVALPVLAMSPLDKGGLGAMALPLLYAGGKVALCAAVAIIGGGRVIPWLLTRIADVRSKELFMLAVLAVALGLAVLAAKLFGVSMALGAFLAGLVVARSDYSARAAAEALPMRDAFAVLFFVSVGLLFNPHELFADPFPAFVMLVVVVIGKPIAGAIVMRMAGEPRGQGLQLGAALGQVGEFTFVLGTSARSLGLIDHTAWNSLVAVAMVSIALNPTLYRAFRKNGRKAPLSAPAADLALPSGHTLLVGYGDVGKRVHADLTTKGVQVVVIDSHLPTVRRLQRTGIRAICGDANLADVIAEAGGAQASGLVICCELNDATQLLKEVSERFPNLRIVIRRMEGSASELTSGPSFTVINEDSETAGGLADALLRRPDPSSGNQPR
ncbi:MAG: cation:proton antiporter [Opitutales bacterium]